MAQAPAATLPPAAEAATVFTVSPHKDAPRTSVAGRGTNPGEVTVQFRRWHAHGNTAYQRGQFAGFPVATALALEQAGLVVVDPGLRRDPAAQRMVRK